MRKCIKVLTVCHGNICRSTMAQSILQHLVNNRGLSDCFYIDSAATSREEIGNSPHYGTVHKLQQVGIPVIPHRAVQMTRQDYLDYDYLIGMDTANIHNMNAIAGGDPQEATRRAKSTSFCRLQERAEMWRTHGIQEILMSHTAM